MTHNPEVVARHGEWIAEVRRVDVKAFDQVLWFWTFRHARAGHFASGHDRSREDAEARARAELERWKALG